jgi:hypothetical protein
MEMERDTEKTKQTETAQGAAQQEVKVFRFNFEKSKSGSESASVYVPARSKEEAEAFIKTQLGNSKDLEYKLETNTERDDTPSESEWKLVDVELEAEKIDGQYIDWDYDEDVLPALGASPKTKEVEVQWSIKWVNFSTTVEASSTENAIDLALQEYKEKGAEAFTIRAGNEDDVDGLDGIFRAGRKWVRVTDEYGNLDDACFRFDDEDEDEDKE